MEKAVIVLAGLILTSGLCFAADQGGAAKASRPAAAAVAKMAQGTIDSISIADPVKKSRSELSLREESGSVVKFLLAGSSAYDANAKHLALSQLKAGEKVKVKYSTTKEGMFEAQSVTLVQ